MTARPDASYERTAPRAIWWIAALPILLLALAASPALAGVVAGAGGVALLYKLSPSAWLGVLTWGLTFHIAVMAFLFGGLGLPGELVRSIAAWKEILVVALLSAALVRALFGRVNAGGMGATDLVVAALFGLALLHALAIPAGLVTPLTASGVAYGIRDVVFFLALFFVGRSTPEIAGDNGALRRMFVVGVVISVVAVIEWIIVTPEMLVVFGVASYFNELLNTSAFTENNEFGLPDNYWTVVGGRLVQRAGSVFMSSQGFAIPFLLIIPAATMWMTVRRRWASVLPLIGYSLLWTGLLLSITRMTIMACVLQMVVIVLLLRRPAALVSLGVAGTAAFTALIAVVPGVAAFVWSTLTWQTGSSASHSRDWTDGVVAMWERPLGHGLATTDQTAVRQGLEPITGDNIYLKYGVELGVLGMILLVALFAMVAWAGIRCALHARTPAHRAFGAFLAAAVAGVAANGMTAVMFNAPMLSYLFFWFAGVGVSVSRLSTDVVPAANARDDHMGA